MRAYKVIEPNKPIRMSGWALVKRSTLEQVFAGQNVYSADALKNGHAVVVGGAPPTEDAPDGVLWCALLRDVMPAPRFGLQWVKLDSEGNPVV